MGFSQTHDKMEEFNKLNFADHPSIASEYTKFLATNAGQVRDWVPKSMAWKRGKRIRKGPGMQCVD